MEDDQLQHALYFSFPATELPIVAISLATFAELCTVCQKTGYQIDSCLNLRLTIFKIALM